MDVDPGAQASMETLTDDEVDALVSAGAWYAKYFQHDVPALAGDESAQAVVRLEHFESLYAALEKLGLRIRRPTGLERNGAGVHRSS